MLRELVKLGEKLGVKTLFKKKSKCWIKSIKFKNWKKID